MTAAIKVLGTLTQESAPPTSSATLVAVGSAGAVATSTDGITWTTRTSPAANDWRRVAWSPTLGLFAAVSVTGNNNRVMTSPDGITWTSRTSAANTFWEDICWVEASGQFVVVGSGGTTTRVMYSTDGITWTPITAHPRGWRSVVWGNAVGGRLVAVASSATGNRAMSNSSSAAGTWTLRTTANDSLAWVSVDWSPELGLFCAISQSGQTHMTSTNGTTWTARTGGPANAMWAMVRWIAAKSRFIAVSRPLNNSTVIMTSPDGITWTTQTTDTVPGGDTNWLAVHYSPALDLAVVVSDNGNLLTSSDLTTWTLRTMPLADWRGLASNG